MVYAAVNTAGVRSWKSPEVVHGNDVHRAKAVRAREISLVSIGVTLPLRLVNVNGEKSTANPLGVPLMIEIVAVSDVGV